MATDPHTSKEGRGQEGFAQEGAGDVALIPPTFPPFTPSYTFQLGKAQVGYEQVGSGDANVAPVGPFDPSTIAWNVVYSDVRVFRRRRFATLESWVGITFPGQIPSQQINLINQGFNRRNFGTLTITGIPQPLSIFIKNVDRSANLLVETADISKQLGTTGTANVRFTMLSTDSFRPSFGDAVVLTEYGKRRFAGYIDEIDFTVYPGTTRLDYLCKCSGWESILQRRLMTGGTYTAALFPTLLTMVQRINAFNLAGENFAVDSGSIDSTITLSSTDDYSSAWMYRKVSDAFNDLALATNTVWWVDNYQKIHFAKPSGMTASSFAIADNNGKQIDSITVTQSLANYRNKQYVKATSNILSQTVTITDSHTFTGVRHPDPVNGPLGIDVVCITTYPFSSQPTSVKENGIEITGTDRFFELKFDGTPTTFPSGGEGWYWMMNSYGVWHWPTSANPTVGTTLDVSYTGVSTFSGNVVVFADASEITAMAARTGGTGVFEEVEQYQGAGTYQQLLDLATGIEKATAPVPTLFTGTTIEQIEDIGFTVGVNLATYGINETLVIQQIQAKSLAMDLGKGTTFRSTLTLVSQKTLGDWRSWYERLLAKLQAIAAIGPLEIAEWPLATDIPGTPSVGLQVGTFGSPHTVQTGLGQIVSASVTGLDAPDAAVTIDIVLAATGKSIFASPMVYNPADSPGAKFYNTFNPQPYNVKQGDGLILKVLTVGTVNPGKNFTVQVIILRKS